MQFSCAVMYLNYIQFVFLKEALIMQGTLRKYIIVCNLLLNSTQHFPSELLLPPESRGRERVFFLYVRSDRMHKAGLWDVCMHSDIAMKPILKLSYYGYSVYGYYFLL